MAIDRIQNNPRKARLFLLVGAIVYFLVCLPLYGRRGFPEVEPFWLAMIWLWIPPVMLASIFERWSSSHAWKLFWYSMGSSFILSWGTPGIIPSYKTAMQAIGEMIIFGPFMVVCVFTIALVSRFFLSFARTFLYEMNCVKCGYNLQGLNEPRCPECGTAFPEELLVQSDEPQAIPVRRRWAGLLTILLLFAWVAFPFAYRSYMFASYSSYGGRMAEEDWASGNVTWYLKTGELANMPPNQAEQFLEYMILPAEDKVDGWSVETMWSDWRKQTWQTAYRETIEQKLKESGKKLSFLE